MQDCDLNKYKKNENVFIDRSDSIFNHNKLVNNLEIIEYLKKKRFLIIKLAELSFNEQIKIFNEAKIIIGSHGAGLTNLIFCEPSTKVIEIETQILIVMFLEILNIQIIITHL